jgi:hypothetical protein
MLIQVESGIPFYYFSFLITGEKYFTNPVKSMLIMLPWLNYRAVHYRSDWRSGLTKQPQHYTVGVLVVKDHRPVMKLHY